MKIRNSSRITALVLALMMIVPLISIPAMAEDTVTTTEEVVKGLVWSEDFQDGTVSDVLAQNPYASELVYGVGGKDSIALKVEQKATWKTELAVLYTDRTGALDVTAVEYADGRAWTGIDFYDGSEVVVTTSEGSGITGVITTVAAATGKIDSCTVVTDNGDYTGGKTLAIVEAPVANAIAGNCSNTYSTVAREAYLKNPAVAFTDEKVVVLEADYYVSTDFSKTIEGRVYGDAGQIDLFRIVPSGTNVVIKMHDCVDVKNGATGVTVAKGQWFNLKFVIDATKGYPTIYCFVNDAFAFAVDESANLAGKTLTTISANKWNLGHLSRGVDAEELAGYWAVDNAEIYNTTAGMDLVLWSNDVDSASAVSDIFSRYVPGGKIAIDSTTFAGTEHGDVIAWDNTPYADGTYWLYTGSGHFGASNNNKITNITVTDGKATGSVTVSGTTYYFKDATVCTTGRTQVAATMYTDADCTTAASVTYYICNGAVATAYTGGCGGNIAEPSRIAPGLTGQKFTISADYNFGLDLTCKGMDIRLQNPNVHFFSIGSTSASATTITVKLHGDLTKDDTTNTIYSNNTLTISKGDWHTFTVTVDSTSDTAGTLITGYVDGELVGSVFMVTNEMTQVDWNVGHTTRNGNPGDNAGHWYMDNFKVELGNTVPAEWNDTTVDSTVLFEEDFNLAGKTAVGKTINYGGSLYGTANVGAGNNAFLLDTDTLEDDNDNTTGRVGNLDKNFIAQLSADVSYSTYESVVLEASYFLEPNSRQQIEAQLRKASATCNATFGGTETTTANAEWVQLYTITQKEDYAYFANFGASASAATAKTTYYNTTCPTGRWFTVSTVINLKTGAMSFYVDGVLAAETYAYATSGATAAQKTWLTNITLLSGTNGVIFAKLNSLKVNSVQAGYTPTWPKGYSGFMLIDDISIYTGTAPKSVKNGVSVDFEDAALATDKTATSAGQIKNGENTIPSSGNAVSQFAPSLAVYEKFAGDWAVKIPMKGVTAETKLTTPFLGGFNSRAYDLTVESDGSWEPVGSGKVTWDMIEGDAAVLTQTSCINGSKPIYYYYDATNEIVHVYNNSGNAVTEDTVGNLKYSKVTLTDANYNAMYRAACGGADANIDKNFYLNTPALTAAGTYVLSADYYIPADASGIAQSQMYTSWVDLYRFDLTNKEFNSANSDTVVGKLLVDQWNNVTMVVTVAEGADVVFDIYLNGIYTHTITKEGYQTVNTNDWIVFKIQKPTSLDRAAALNGEVYVDNVQFNAVAYDATDFVEVDTTNAIQISALGYTHDVATTSVKIYAPNGYGMLAASDYEGMIETAAAASMRLRTHSTNSGLRFATKVDEALLDELYAMKEAGLIADVRFGTLIAPLDADNSAEGGELTLGAEFKFLNVEADYEYYFDADASDATTHFVGSIINIYDFNYTRAFSGRGYVEITLNNGTVYTVYSAYTHSANVAEQAQKTIDSGLVTDETLLGILSGYVGN